MSKTAPRALFALVESFFTVYLPRQRGASVHTIRAYRDSLKLLLEFVAQTPGSWRRRARAGATSTPRRSAASSTTSRPRARTRRSRATADAPLSAASSSTWFAMTWRTRCSTRGSWPSLPKKARHRPATYLEADDVRAIIGNPDRRTADGWRDYTLLLFLYNCGARVSEAGGVRWDDLQLAPPRQVRLRGKGKKERLLPIWRETANALHRLRGLAHANDQQHVFVNRHGQPLTRDGIAYILHKHASAVAKERPPLARKRITPHVLRHSCAVALLQSGTDVTVIRDYLGHASVATTDRYITTNLQMKRDAMQSFWKHAGIEPSRAKPWKPKADLLAFLQSL